MNADLISKAKGGDKEAFQVLTEPHRRELQVHCYRMLGSFQDAEDALQETLVTAWRSFDGFEARASVRTWLYRIATNQCLNARRTEARRPAKEWNVPGVKPPPEPTSRGEVTWLEPFPDALYTEQTLHVPLGPDAIYERNETMSLAFITALQLLPPRQLAVLVLRDVLGFEGAEVAEMLDATLDSTNSALKRARATLEEKRRRDREPSRTTNEEEHEIVRKFITAYESADLEAVVALLTDNVFISMPPMPFEYEGKALVGAFCGRLFEAGRIFKLVPTRANGQPAFGTYLRTTAGSLSEGVGLIALTLSGNQISAMTRFENTVLASFKLPPSLPAG